MTPIDKLGMGELVERLRSENDALAAVYQRRDFEQAEFSCDAELVSNAICRIDEAADAITALIAERDALDGRRLAHIQKLERRIHNQRQNARDNWEIVEMRNKWLGTKASRDGYLRAHHRAKKAEAQLKAAREALRKINALLPNPTLPITHAIKDIALTALSLDTKGDDDGAH